MKTTVEIVGLPDLVLRRAVDIGIARSKTDAIRVSILALNERYKLVKDAEDEMVVQRIREMEENNRKAGRQPESLGKVLAKYPHLKRKAKEH